MIQVYGDFTLILKQKTIKQKRLLEKSFMHLGLESLISSIFTLK